MNAAEKPYLDIRIDWDTPTNRRALKQWQRKSELDARSFFQKEAAKEKAATDKLSRDLSAIKLKALERERVKREIQADRDRQRELTKTKTWSQKMLGQMKAQTTLMAGFITAYVGMAIRNLVSGTISWAGELATASEALGVTVEQMSGLQYAAASTGSNIESVNKLLVTLQQRLEDARLKPTGTYATFFKAFGVDTQQDIIGVMDQLARMNDVGKVAEIVGARYAAVLARIQTRFDGVSGAIEQARSEHAVLDQTAAKNLDDLGAHWEQFGIRVKATFANNIAPVLDAMAVSLTPNQKVKAGVTGLPVGAGGVVNAMINKFVSDIQAEIDRIVEMNKNTVPFGPPTEGGGQYSKPQITTKDLIAPATVSLTAYADAADKARKETEALIKVMSSLQRGSFGGVGVGGFNAGLGAGEGPFDAMAMIEPLTTSEKLLTQIQDNWQSLAQNGIGAATSALSVFVAQSQAAADAESMRTQQLVAQQELARSAMLKAGLEGTRQYDQLIAKQEKALAAQQKREQQAKAKAWESQHEADIAEALANTFVATTATYKSFPVPPLSYIMAGLTAAAGLAQVANISAQNNPYRYMQGGWTPGNVYTDSLTVRTQGGEFIVNRQAAQANADTLEAMNRGESVRGGGTTIHVHIGQVIGTDRASADNLARMMIPALRRAKLDGVVL